MKPKPLVFNKDGMIARKKKIVILPCDDIPNWLGDESCKLCPSPCE